MLKIVLTAAVLSAMCIGGFAYAAWDAGGNTPTNKALLAIDRAQPHNPVTLPNTNNNATREGMTSLTGNGS